VRIALVNPITRLSQGYHTIGRFIPQLGLQVLANRVPAGHQVDIIDEIFGPECTAQRVRKGQYDLVAVTGYTSGASRAYEIAAQARGEGIPTIMGGPHASAMPAEAAAHFDSVAVGECDEIWPGILADAAAGRLQKNYTGGMPELVNGLGAARQDLDPINGKYQVSCIQTSRGCPVGCDFCGVTKFNGPNIRRRPIDEVVAEWNQTTKPFIFMVDDNFFGVSKAQADWAKQCLRRLAQRGNKRRLWFSQTTVNMGDDAEGLDLAYKAGCRGMLVGFETFNRENLASFHKALNRNNLERYEELVNGFHRGRIAVMGCFIIGGDADDENTAAFTLQEARRLGIDITQITNLTPLPGTKLYDTWMAEGRITATNYPADWETYTFTDTVFTPAKMSARQLDQSIFEIRSLAATQPWVWPRMIRSLILNRSLTTALFVFGMNRGWKRMARKQVARDSARFGAVQKDSDRFRRLKSAFGWRLVFGYKPPQANQPAASDQSPAKP
jgi:radical SAM superfamily enzyme YgiQ (UPF0313 family)